MSTPRDTFSDWIGRSETRCDTITPTPWLALAATLDLAAPDAAAGTPLPPLAHWLYALPLHRASEIGTDGHAKRGGFLPPIDLPRRMWAGGRFEFHHPLRVGDGVTRTSTIENVTSKSGQSGPLVFVTVRHDWQRDGASHAALSEWHDIVYRDAPSAGAAAPASRVAPTHSRWSREIVADAVLLFRYSALTFNAHRIHYDLGYVATVEGYPGLVVHGPLIATLLVDLLRRELPEADMATFAFKAVGPLFATRPFHLHGVPEADRRTIRLWATNPDGGLAMEASATLR